MDAAAIRYTPAHEWCRMEGNALIIGVTPNALAAIGDAVYIDMPSAGDDVLKEIPFGEIEGTKGSKEISSPADGAVLEVNIRIAQSPDLLAKKPIEECWLIKLKPDAPVALDHLLTDVAYDALIKKKRAK